MAIELPADATGADNPDSCSTHTCRENCGVEVLDEFLRNCQEQPSGIVDLTLDLRWLLQRRREPDRILGLFFDLRTALQGHNYIAFYRLRRWLEHHIRAQVAVVRGAGERSTSIRLDQTGIDALREACLQAVLIPGDSVVSPRVNFQFRSA